MPKKPGLYTNINAKRERIEAGRPSAAAFKAAAKTAKKPKRKKK